MHDKIAILMFASLTLVACGDANLPPSTPTPPPAPDVKFTFVDDPNCKNSSDRWKVTANNYAWPDGTTGNMRARMFRSFYCGKYYDRFRKKELVPDATLAPNGTKNLECVYETELTSDYADCDLGLGPGPQTITLRTSYEKACLGKESDPSCVPGPTKSATKAFCSNIQVLGFNASAKATFDKLKDSNNYPVKSADLEAEWVTKPSGCKRSNLTLDKKQHILNSGEECRIEGTQFNLDFVVKIPTEVEAAAAFSPDQIEYTISNTGQQIAVEYKTSPGVPTTKAIVERITVRATSAALDLRLNTGAEECLEVKF
jgi:hypothetical protein